MIVLDTTILVYAVGRDHALTDPCRSIFNSVEQGHLQATTSVEVIQEFVHVRARRRSRADAARLGEAYAQLLSPLMLIEEEHLRAGLELFREHEALGAFDAVLAAAAIATGAAALISADTAFSEVSDLTFVDPQDKEMSAILEG